MKRIFFLLFLILPFTYFSEAQRPSSQELRDVSEDIETLLKVDSLNQLIIDELEDSLATANNSSSGVTDTSEGQQPPANELIDPANEGKITGETPEKEKESMFGFILIAIGAGLISLFTPCVFPMIPMTVSFFTSTSSTRTKAIRKALIYGVSIIVIYTTIGVLFSILMGPAFPTFLSTHWIPNTLFFLVFVIFGLSFLGLFDINLPSSFVNKMDHQADKGGLYGVFFMAFTLVLVSFSCTGPIVGSLFVEALRVGGARPVIGMLAYSAAFALPFTLFALFPHVLNKLPKSGGWLNVIKVTLGFVELGLSLKFLSMVDQVYHLEILDRELFITIWIVLSFLLGYYFLGKIRLPHDSPVEKTSVPRLIFAIISFTFAVYLFPGLFGAPLKTFSGYLPPMSTHDFNLGRLFSGNTGSNSVSLLCDENPKYSDFLDLPPGFRGYFDLEEAIECAKEKGMPVFIDFTGHGCTNCREVEANIWTVPKVMSTLKQDYILASLYVDEKRELPQEEQYESEEGFPITTIGEKNFDIEKQEFGVTAQPYYVLLDPYTGKKLVETPMGYTSDEDEFYNYLLEGLKKFRELHPETVENQ